MTEHDWWRSIEAADHIEPVRLARPVLELAALLDGHGVPVRLFTSEPITAHLARRRGAPTTVADTMATLRCLERMGLVTADAGFSAVEVAGTVPHVVRASIPDGRLGDHAVAAADALLAIWPDVDETADDLPMLRDHTEALLGHAESRLWQDGLHPVVFRAGHSLAREGLHPAAVAYWERLLPAAHQRLGPDHPDTFVLRNNLAWSYGRRGDPHRALTELRALLPDRRRVLGDDDVNVLATRHGIAVWRHDTGDIDGARAEMDRLLDDYLRVLGPLDRDTLNTRLLLATWAGEAGSPGTAATALRALVDDYTELLGADHPETLDARYQLAECLLRAGAPDEASEVLDDLLADSRRVLGPDHRDTLLVRHLRAHVPGAAGDPAATVAALRELRGDVADVYGPDSPLVQALNDEISRLASGS
ncbi:MAG TPA: tetratricopeptide repeat protein [Actinoplanes sp.]|nr:tetratricopeptide repeat protein [Actinoplanes sp.]